MDRTACTDPQSLYCTTDTLLGLWAVRTLQSIIPCTEQLYLYSSFGQNGIHKS